MDELRVCLEQKQILLTKLLDLSHQIEVQCEMPEHLDLSELIGKRQIYLERLKKCTDRIAILQSKLPPQEQKRMNMVLLAKVPKEECTMAETNLLNLEDKCRTLLKQIAACDTNSKRKMKQECDRLRQLVNDSRGPEKSKSMFF